MWAWEARACVGSPNAELHTFIGQGSISEELLPTAAKSVRALIKSIKCVPAGAVGTLVHIIDARSGEVVERIDDAHTTQASTGAGDEAAAAAGAASTAGQQQPLQTDAPSAAGSAVAALGSVARLPACRAGGALAGQRESERLG